MPTVGVVIDVDDDQHYAVSLHEQTAGGFAEVSRVLVDRPLPPLDGDDEWSPDLAAQFRDALSGPHPDVQAVRRLGKHLWRVTFGEAIGPAWAGRNPPRTLLDIRPDELQRLPWEALQQNLKIMFMAPEPFVRAPLSSLPVPTVDAPLRVLVVVGECLDETLKWRDELRALEVLGARMPDRFHVEVLEAPDKPRLSATCEELRPHVLHVIAHGMVLGGSPGVRIGHPPTSFVLDADVIVNQLPYKFPLVVLNACHTGESAALDGAMGLGEAFRDNGSLATVCIQGAIHGAAAGDFSRAFYRAVVAGEPLDVACVAGRQAIAAQHDGVDLWLPQLVLRAAPGPLLTPPPQLAAPDPEAAVDRAAERRQLLFALAPDAQIEPRRAAIVHGDADVGKTWVARSAGYLLRSAGAVVRYVDLSGSSPLGWQDVLRAIRDPATGDGPPTALLPAELFALFNAGLNAVAVGKPPPGRVDGVVVDEGSLIGPVGERTLDHIGTLFDVFLQTLTTAAGGRRLILVLDHLDNVDPAELTKFIVPRLVRPIAQGEVPDVSVVLVAGATALDPLRGLPAVLVPVQLPGADEFLRFAAVYRDIRFATAVFDQATIDQYDSYVKVTRVNGPWRLRKLRELYHLSTGAEG